MAGFPARWTPAEQDAAPAYWMAGYLAYFTAKGQFEQQQLAALRQSSR